MASGIDAPKRVSHLLPGSCLFINIQLVNLQRKAHVRDGAPGGETARSRQMRKSMPRPRVQNCRGVSIRIGTVDDDRKGRTRGELRARDRSGDLDGRGLIAGGDG